jgi:hypothetical protein
MKNLVFGFVCLSLLLYQRRGVGGGSAGAFPIVHSVCVSSSTVSVIID